MLCICMALDNNCNSYKEVFFSWPGGYKTFFMPNSAEHEIDLYIIVKMPTNVGILTFITRIYTASERFKQEKLYFFSI